MANRKPTEVFIKCIISFPAIFTPRKADKDSDKLTYGAQLLIDKSDTQTVEAVKKAILAAKKIGVQEKWGGKVPAGYKSPLRDGDAKPSVEDDDDAPATNKPEHKGRYFINVNNAARPGALVRVNGKNVPASEEDIYPGAICYVAANFFPYNKKSNGVAGSLNNILKVADGPRLDGRRSAEDDFEDLDLTDLDDIEISDDDDIDDLL